ncbi:MAG: hypothetical protein HY290_32575 [Planctomycetia bacterium]|nr:hypothetical protein [Planctomycetia bacterium]
MPVRLLAAVAIWHALTSSVCAQTRTVTVSQPTRLDWEFAASAFGRDPDSALPADYDSKRQKYQLYIPAGYDKSRAWPLIVFISPGPGPLGWASFQPTCEAQGLFFCSPHKAGNETRGVLRTRIVLDMVDDVRRKFRIDPNQTFIGGFSGGGRMSCSIGFALPDIFAGVIPVCGTNPIRTEPWLLHRLVDRTSVAFVTGERDKNRRETEVWMTPWLQDVDVRTRLWVVPGMGHDIPGPEVMNEVLAWLQDDLQRRQDDARLRPQLNLQFDEALRGDSQAERLLAAGREEIRHQERLWRGVAIFQGIARRWPNSPAAGESRTDLMTMLANPEFATTVAQQRLEDHSKSFKAQARGFERMGNYPKAIEVWETLARNHSDAPVADEARAEARRLKELKATSPPASVRIEKKKRTSK